MSGRIELRRDSVASIVLDSFGVASSPVRRSERSLPANSVASIVLGATIAKRATSSVAGMLAAMVLYAGIATATMHSANRSPRGIGAAPQPMALEHIVDLDSPPAPDLPPEAPEVPAPSPVRAEAAARSARSSGDSSPNPPAPAAAGRAVAAEPAAAEALDFTGFDIATGQGRAYAGGVTAASGNNDSALHTPRGERNARSGVSSGRVARARSVGLPATDWSCPWPHEADALSIDEETVVIRVVVRPNGTVASAVLLSDPGHGFGAVALSCARGHKFPPALGDNGAPITAASPPIRVHFIRSAR